MNIETLELVRALAVAGLLTGTAAYFMLIRRRRWERDDAQERLREESNSRAVARFRHLQGNEDTAPGLQSGSRDNELG